MLSFAVAVTYCFGAEQEIQFDVGNFSDPSSIGES